MKAQIDQILVEIEAFEPSGEQRPEDEFKSLFTGKKGAINALFGQFKELPGSERAQFGKLLNELKQAGQAKLKDIQNTSNSTTKSAGPEDMTLPGDAHSMGSRHPLMTTMQSIINIFERIGFSVADGPEIEDDWHNFTALNLPLDHPAREMQDTFFIQQDPAVLLRTHTSNVQIRVMENNEPPIRILAPGRVYRNETISARAHCFFHQVEGLYIDKKVSFPDMMQVLDYFVKHMFGADKKIRLRPSFFPFTEISAEMDVSCVVCDGDGCQLCKYTGWVEIMGCGMVDPNVLENCKIDPDKYSGYAFGMGVERIAQLLYKVPDLRLYSQNDVRFLSQFEKINS